MLKIAFSPIYKYDLPARHRFPMEKYELIPEQLVYEGTITPDQLFEPGEMSYKDLLTTHTSEYVDKVLNQKLTAKEIRKIGFPMSTELVEREVHIVQGTWECVGWAREYGIAMNVAGGTHHAYADKGEGFCIFNDVALASNLLLQKEPNSKILIIDLDVHQGNGTAKLLEKEDRVFTLSIHGERNYPMHKETSDWDVELEDGTQDTAYLEELQKVLDHLKHRIDPDLIFYISGVDVLDSDKLGRLSLTRRGCYRRDEMVINYAYDRQIPIVIAMGGGYSHRLPDIVEAHANTFRIAADRLDG
ncbi:histone deacetylase [Membranicola marinus]|uniref:Histone deacetylase n=1 Tax=Membranihabitans marinus TaxID=1227546 RepID=A0A953HVI4_9BACT|nr:histone deacetylase [Membranihabitans marinus]MBY5956552.1 histone deacetylase [Membranihabitans marinus]